MGGGSGYGAAVGIGCCGVSLFGTISLILGFIIFFTTPNNMALVDNTCFESAVTFKMADHHIPNVIDDQVDFAWVSVDSNMTQNHYLGPFKDWSLAGGIINIFFGIKSRTSYPDDSDCLDREPEKLRMATCLMVFHIISLCFIGLSCFCCCGIAALSNS